MQQIAAKGITNNILHSLWMNRPPTSAKCILLASESAKLETIADIAERILGNSSQCDSAAKRLVAIERSLSELKTTVVSFPGKQRSKSRNRSYSPK